MSAGVCVFLCVYVALLYHIIFKGKCVGCVFVREETGWLRTCCLRDGGWCFFWRRNAWHMRLIVIVDVVGLWLSSGIIFALVHNGNMCVWQCSTVVYSLTPHIVHALMHLWNGCESLMWFICICIWFQYQIAGNHICSQIHYRLLRSRKATHHSSFVYSRSFLHSPGRWKCASGELFYITPFTPPFTPESFRWWGQQPYLDTHKHTACIHQWMQLCDFIGARQKNSKRLQ